MSKNELFTQLVGCLVAHADGNITDAQVARFLDLQDNFVPEEIQLAQDRARDIERSELEAEDGPRIVFEPDMGSPCVHIDLLALSVHPRNLQVQLGEPIGFRNAAGAKSTTASTLCLDVAYCGDDEYAELAACSRSDAPGSTQVWDMQRLPAGGDTVSWTPIQKGFYQFHSEVYPFIRGSVHVTSPEAATSTAGPAEADTAAAAAAGDALSSSTFPIGQNMSAEAGAHQPEASTPSAQTRDQGQFSGIASEALSPYSNSQQDEQPQEHLQVAAHVDRLPDPSVPSAPALTSSCSSSLSSHIANFPAYGVLLLSVGGVQQQQHFSIAVSPGAACTRAADPARSSSNQPAAAVLRPRISSTSCASTSSSSSSSGVVEAGGPVGLSSSGRSESRDLARGTQTASGTGSCASSTGSHRSGNSSRGSGYGSLINSRPGSRAGSCASGPTTPSDFAAKLTAEAVAAARERGGARRVAVGPPRAPPLPGHFSLTQGRDGGATAGGDVDRPHKTCDAGMACFWQSADRDDTEERDPLGEVPYSLLPNSDSGSADEDDRQEHHAGSCAPSDNRQISDTCAAAPEPSPPDPNARSGASDLRAGHGSQICGNDSIRLPPVALKASAVRTPPVADNPSRPLPPALAGQKPPATRQDSKRGPICVEDSGLSMQPISSGLSSPSHAEMSSFRPPSWQRAARTSAVAASSFAEPEAENDAGSHSRGMRHADGGGAPGSAAVAPVKNPQGSKSVFVQANEGCFDQQGLSGQQKQNLAGHAMATGLAASAAVVAAKQQKQQANQEQGSPYKEWAIPRPLRGGIVSWEDSDGDSLSRHMQLAVSYQCSLCKTAYFGALNFKRCTSRHSAAEIKEFDMEAERQKGAAASSAPNATMSRAVAAKAAAYKKAEAKKRTLLEGQLKAYWERLEPANKAAVLGLIDSQHQRTDEILSKALSDGQHASFVESNSQEWYTDGGAYLLQCIMQGRKAVSAGSALPVSCSWAEWPSWDMLFRHLHQASEHLVFCTRGFKWDPTEHLSRPSAVLDYQAALAFLVEMKLCDAMEKDRLESAERALRELEALEESSKAKAEKKKDKKPKAKKGPSAPPSRRQDSCYGSEAKDEEVDSQTVSIAHPDQEPRGAPAPAAAAPRDLSPAANGPVPAATAPYRESPAVQTGAKPGAARAAPGPVSAGDRRSSQPSGGSNAAATRPLLASAAPAARKLSPASGTPAAAEPPPTARQPSLAPLPPLPRPGSGSAAAGPIAHPAATGQVAPKAQSASAAAMAGPSLPSSIPAAAGAATKPGVALAAAAAAKLATSSQAAMVYPSAAGQKQVTARQPVLQPAPAARAMIANGQSGVASKVQPPAAPLAPRAELAAEVHVATGASKPVAAAIPAKPAAHPAVKPAAALRSGPGAAATPAGGAGGPVLRAPSPAGGVAFKPAARAASTTAAVGAAGGGHVGSTAVLPRRRSGSGSAVAPAAAASAGTAAAVAGTRTTSAGTAPAGASTAVAGTRTAPAGTATAAAVTRTASADSAAAGTAFAAARTAAGARSTSVSAAAPTMGRSKEATALRPGSVGAATTRAVVAAPDSNDAGAASHVPATAMHKQQLQQSVARPAQQQQQQHRQQQQQGPSVQERGQFLKTNSNEPAPISNSNRQALLAAPADKVVPKCLPTGAFIPVSAVPSAAAEAAPVGNPAAKPASKLATAAEPAASAIRPAAGNTAAEQAFKVDDGAGPMRNSVRTAAVAHPAATPPTSGSTATGTPVLPVPPVLVLEPLAVGRPGLAVVVPEPAGGLHLGHPPVYMQASHQQAMLPGYPPMAMPNGPLYGPHVPSADGRSWHQHGAGGAMQSGQHGQQAGHHGLPMTGPMQPHIGIPVLHSSSTRPLGPPNHQQQQQQHAGPHQQPGGHPSYPPPHMAGPSTSGPAGPDAAAAAAPGPGSGNGTRRNSSGGGAGPSAAGAPGPLTAGLMAGVFVSPQPAAGFPHGAYPQQQQYPPQMYSQQQQHYQVQPPMYMQYNGGGMPQPGGGGPGMTPGMAPHGMYPFPVAAPHGNQQQPMPYGSTAGQPQFGPGNSAVAQNVVMGYPVSNPGMPMPQQQYHYEALPPHHSQQHLQQHPQQLPQQHLQQHHQPYPLQHPEGPSRVQPGSHHPHQQHEQHPHQQRPQQHMQHSQHYHHHQEDIHYRQYQHGQPGGMDAPHSTGRREHDRVQERPEMQSGQHPQQNQGQHQQQPPQHQQKPRQPPEQRQHQALTSSSSMPSQGRQLAGITREGSITEGTGEDRAEVSIDPASPPSIQRGRGSSSGGGAGAGGSATPTGVEASEVATPSCDAAVAVYARGGGGGGAAGAHRRASTAGAAENEEAGTSSVAAAIVEREAETQHQVSQRRSTFSQLLNQAFTTRDGPSSQPHSAPRAEPKAALPHDGARGRQDGPPQRAEEVHVQNAAAAVAMAAADTHSGLIGPRGTTNGTAPPQPWASQPQAQADTPAEQRKACFDAAAASEELDTRWLEVQAALLSGEVEVLGRQ